MRKLLFLSLLAFGLSTTGDVFAQALTTVSFDSGSQQLFSDSAKTIPLTAGNVNTSGDGALLQLGYYSSGTNGSPFTGTFISLAGTGTLNTAYSSITVGDDPADAGGDGTFALTLSFSQGSPTTGNTLPAAGVPLVIQFYNGTSLASSTAYNAVSDAIWDWKTPSNPPSTVGITLDDSNLQFLGGANSAFYTSQSVLVVPEPSSFELSCLTVVGLLWLLRVRRTT